MTTDQNPAINDYETKNKTAFYMPENLFEADDETLSALSSNIGLCMPLSLLRDVGKCLRVEKILPSEEILHFFNDLFSASEHLASSFTLNNVITDDQAPSLTLCDLYQKAKAIKAAMPLSFTEAIGICSAYLCRIGAYAPDSICQLSEDDVPNDNCLTLDLSLDGEHTIKLAADTSPERRYGFTSREFVKRTDPEKSKNPSLPANTDILLVYKSEDNASAYKKLSEDERFASTVAATVEIEERGIIYALQTLCAGAQINLCPRPAEEEIKLSDLVRLHHGAHLLAPAYEKDAEDVYALASEYGMNCVFIAKTVIQPCVVFHSPSRQFSIHASFLKRIAQRSVDPYLDLTNEAPSTAKYSELIYKCSDESKVQYINGKVMAESFVLSAKACLPGFYPAANAVIDSLLPLLAMGVDRRKVALTMRYGIDPNDPNATLASLLGAYRVMIELCIPDVDPSLLKCDDPMFFCAAYAKKTEEEYIRDTFSTAGNGVFLLKIDTASDGLPDFASLRDACDKLRKAQLGKNVISACAVNGSVMLALNEMFSEKFTLLQYESATVPEQNTMGFLLEMPAGASLGVPLGILKSVTPDETDKTEEIKESTEEV